jgi:hypothetical protein
MATPVVRGISFTMSARWPPLNINIKSLIMRNLVHILESLVLVELMYALRLVAAL